MTTARSLAQERARAEQMRAEALRLQMRAAEPVPESYRTRLGCRGPRHVRSRRGSGAQIERRKARGRQPEGIQYRAVVSEGPATARDLLGHQPGRGTRGRASTDRCAEGGADGYDCSPPAPCRSQRPRRHHALRDYRRRRNTVTRTEEDGRSGPAAGYRKIFPAVRRHHHRNRSDQPAERIVLRSGERAGDDCRSIRTTVSTF